MPFTIAHAAAAPFLRRLTGRHLPMSGLAIGAMSPDFEYLAHGTATRTIGHTPLGIFLLCLPTGLAVLALWHAYVRALLIRLAPARLAALLPPPGPARSVFGPFRSWPALVTAATAILAGAWSHVAWDAFTHRNGLFVGHLGLLDTHIGNLPLHRVLQYVSSVAGLALLTLWAGRDLKRRWRAHGGLAPDVASLAVGSAPRRWRRQAWAVIVLVVAAGAGVNALRFPHSNPKRALVRGVLGAMGAGALALPAAGFVLEVAVSRETASEDPPSG